LIFKHENMVLVGAFFFNQVDTRSTLVRTTIGQGKGVVINMDQFFTFGVSMFAILV